LLNNVVATAATAGGTADALRKDLGNLAAVVAPIAGLNLAYVAAPNEAAKIMLAVGPQFQFPVLASGALANGTVICVALNGLTAAVDPMPRIEISREALLHMETAPLQFATGPQGSAVVATPSRSLFQSDTVGVRLIMQLAWGLRAANAIAYTSGVTW
jgi:hypothetical protein